MKTVGIIANPNSGKDIRRMIARGTTVTNQEKRNIIVRMLLAMDAHGVERVAIMPDRSGLARQAMQQLHGDLQHTCVELLDLPYILGTADDSLRAAQRMAECDFACIVVMGGDGTSRIAAKRCGEVPLIPVSTGTNNVFPQMVEGTLVGMAAAALADGTVSVAESSWRAPRLELWRGSELLDIALVDLVVVDAGDIAARAVWQPESIRSLYLTQASPAAIGLSSIGGQLHSLSPCASEGMVVHLGQGGNPITAPIAPGLLCRLAVQSWETFSADLPQLISGPCAIALDGERELILREGEQCHLRYSSRGPRVVDIEALLARAAAVRNSHTQGAAACANWS